MASIPGTVVVSRIVPTDTADTFATHDEKYGRGGYRSVQTLTDLHDITPERRTEGMLVTVIGEGNAMYRLEGGITNSDWVSFTVDPYVETKTVKIFRSLIVFNADSSVSIGNALPIGATVNTILVNVTQAFDSVAPTVSFGVAGQTSELGTNDESDLTIVSLYSIGCYKVYNANEQIVATYVSNGATVGAASIEVFYSIN